MLLDFPSITETSTIINPTVPSGPVNPANPSIGELFLKTTTGSLEIYTGSTWTVAGDNVVSAHAADTALHLTPAQNTLLDNISGISATEINYLAGVTSNIQTQFNTLSSTLTTHASSTELHLSTAQNNFLDGLNLPTLTSAHVNHLVGVSSNVQDQLNAIVAVNNAQATTLTSLQAQINTNDINQTNALATHIADGALHISAAQNTFLDGLNLPTLTAANVNHLVGVTSNVQSQFTDITTNRLHRNGSVTMTGNLNVGGNRIIGLSAPVAATDAANKQYVDDLVAGLSWKQAVVAATTANITLSGTQTIDGVLVGIGQRVLVKDQTAPQQNGIYLCAASAWSRAPDAQTSSELDGAAVFVLAGTTNADSAWIQVTDNPVVDTSPISWSRFAAAGGATPGNGINITGSVISVANGPGLTFTGGNLTLALSAHFGFSGNDLILSDSGAAPGTYGSGNLIPVISVDSKGRVTNITTTAPTGYQPSNAFLTALTTTGSGIQVKTGTNTAAARAITTSGNGISIVNGDGISGNPTINSSATSNNTPNSIVFRDATGAFSAGTITANLNGNISGNASTATTLQTSRLINGFSFNGSSNISFHYDFTQGVASPGPLTFPSGSVTLFNAYNSTDFPSQYWTGLTIKTDFSQAAQLAINWNQEEDAPTDFRFRVNDDTSDTAAWGPWRQIVVNGTDVGPWNINISGAASLNVLKTGDTMTGNLTIGQTNQQLVIRRSNDQYLVIENNNTTTQPVFTSYSAPNNAKRVTFRSTTDDANTPLTSGFIGFNFNLYNNAVFQITEGGISWTGTASGNGSGINNLNASNLASGTVPAARLGAGSPSAARFLRGDGVWSNQIIGDYISVNRDTNSGFEIRTGNQATDEKSWYWITNGSIIALRAYNDAGNNQQPAMLFTRSGFTVTGWDFYVNNNSVISANSNRQVTIGTPASGSHTINGNVTFGGAISGNGSGITNLNASNLASGTVPAGRLSGSYSIDISGTAGNTNSISNAVGGTYTWTGTNYFRSNKGPTSYLGANSSYNLQAFADDGGAAAMSFHRSGAYAVNMGLDPDNVFRIGGWSAPSNRLQLDMSGNLTVAGHMNAAYLSQSSGNSENPTISQVMVTNGSDNFLRKASIGHLTSSLTGTAPINITGVSNNTNSISNAVGANYTWTGLQQFSGAGDNTGSSGRSGHFEAISPGGATAATMSFHRSGIYAVNMGLDNDNVFRLGGWSDGANVHRWSSDVNGNFTARGNVTAYSDRRLKTDIEPIHNALDKVQQLNGVSYKRIDSGEYQVGLIAQDVEKVIGEVVKEQDGYKTVAYGNLVAVLIEAIKELRAEVEALKKARE